MGWPDRGDLQMHGDDQTGYLRMPGLFRLWDLQFVIEREDDYFIHCADLNGDGAPLFAVYRRPAPAADQSEPGALQ